MSVYILRRILITIPVLLGVSLIIFSIMRLTPGDPTILMLGDDASAEAISELRHDLGLDKPFLAQYLIYLKKILQGDLGTSIWRQAPVFGEVWRHFKATFVLAIASLMLSTTFGISAGILASVRPHSVFDKMSMSVVLFGQSMPAFWLGIILILFFSLRLNLLPPGEMYPYGSREIGALIKHLVLPAVTLAARTTAIIARLTRSSMLEVLQQQYIITARAKGIGALAVVLKHALKNAFIPVITVIGVQMGVLLGGAIIVETVFAWPGLGTLILKAISRRDYPLVQGGILFIAFTFTIINLLVDITYAYFDPRIRYK